MRGDPSSVAMAVNLLFFPVYLRTIHAFATPLCGPPSRWGSEIRVDSPREPFLSESSSKSCVMLPRGGETGTSLSATSEGNPASDTPMMTTENLDLPMAQANARAATLQRLLSNRSYDIEFYGFLSNHVKHAVIALEKLDASKHRLEEYWNIYTDLTPYNLKLHRITGWEKIQPCSPTDWKELRGKKKNWPSMVKFMEQELDQRFDNNVNRLVAYYAPELLPGMAGALTHGIIHLGWAIDAYDSRSPSLDAWMILEGLAYLNFSFLSVHPENFIHSGVDEESPVDSIRRIATVWQEDELAKYWIANTKARYGKDSGFHTELIPAGFQWELSKVLSHQHEVAFKLPSWLDKLNINLLTEQLYKTTVLLYLMTRDTKDGHGNFLVLHLISSLRGLENTLAFIKDETLSRNAFKEFYVAMVCLLSTSTGGFPSAEVIDAAATRYWGDDKTDADANQLKTTEWPSVVARAISETEEHNIKLVYVTRDLWNRYGYWTGFREAAKTFTLTPNIGPSSGFSQSSLDEK